MGAVDYCAEGQLLMARHADLADEENVKWSTERFCDLEAYGHSAARQGQHDRLGIAETLQCLCKLAAGVGPIPEELSQGGALPGGANFLQIQPRLLSMVPETTHAVMAARTL